jgi:glycine/D-amino acid oxidase-like deaminating enzyme
VTTATSDPFAATEQRAYWQATMPVLPDRRGRPLPDAVDVLVVGGGYTGVSCARTLAKAGAQVTLIEAETLGWGASTRNGGIVHPGYKWGPKALLRRFGDDLGRRLWEETLDGYTFLRGVIADEAIDCGLTENGHLELAYSPAHVHELETAKASLDFVGTPASLVSRERIREEVGTDAYFGALAIEGSGGLHPGKYFAGLAEAASRAGADLHEGVRALRVRPQRDRRLVVETTRGAVIARDVVVATNGYTDGFVPALRRRIIPLGSYIIASEPLPEELARELSPRGRMFFDTKNFLYYWRVHDRRMVFGGRASFLPTTFARAARILHRGLLEVHPQLAGYRIEYAWGGKVGFTWDRMPHVGRLANGVTYAMGYCGTGVVMATYVGSEVAGWLGGAPAPALAALRFPLVPVPYEGRPWFMMIGGEWFRLQDRLAARARGRPDSV